MFSFGDKSNVIEKARKVSAKGDTSKAIEILRNAFTNEESDLPLVLEIMHTFLTIDKLNEVVVWAKKGEKFSSSASKKILSEMEDLYYGRGKPDQLAEYIIEKKAEKREFEDVFDILREVTEEGKKHFQEKEERVVDNIPKDKKKYSERDLTHLYLLSITLEGKDNKRSVNILRQIIKKNPNELEIVINELRRANQEFYGDEWLLLGLGHALLLNELYAEGISKIRDALNKNDGLLQKVLTILNSFSDKSQEILDYLSELYIDSGKEEEALKIIEAFEKKEAIKKYQKMVKKNPNNPILHNSLANAYLEEKRYSESLKEFFASVEISKDEEIGKIVKEIQSELPNELDPHLYLSSIYAELGWKEEAVNTLEKAFEIDPTAASEISEKLDSIFKDTKESKKALPLKARLISREGNVDNALDIFKELAQQPDGLNAAREGLNNLMKENPHNTEVELINLMLKIPGEQEETAQRVDRILSKEPNYVPFLLTEYDGWIRSKSEVAPQFLYFYELLDEKNFPPFTYPFAIAELKRITKDFDNAEKFYIEALYEDPERFNFILDELDKHREQLEIRRIIASLYFYKGEFKKGCNELKIALKHFPKDVSNITTLLIKYVHSKKGNKYLYQTLTEILLNQEHYEEAINWGKKAIALVEVEKQGELLLDLSKANAKIKNYSEASKLARRAWSIDNSLINHAITVLEEIRETENPEPDILMSLYELYSEKEDTQKCTICLDDVLKQKPSMADIITGEYEKLIEISPIDASLRIHYGKAKLMMGDETGISEIEKGLRFNPGISEEAMQALEGHEDPEIVNKALYVKGKILTDLGRKEEAIENFIESYWKNEDEKDKALDGIESIFSSIELSGDLLDKLFDVYYKEGRNTRLVNLIESYFDGSKERGKFINQKIDYVFKDGAPLPLRILQAGIYYKIDEKEKAKSGMEYLLKEHPNVADQLKDIVNPEDPDILHLLIKINLELSNWDTLNRYIKQLDINERLPYYEQILDKAPDNETTIKEAGYIYFLSKDWEKARLYLKSISNPTSKEEVLLWWSGEDKEVSLKEINDSREEILHDMITIAESPERRVQLYIEMGEYDNAYNEIKNIEGDKREILISILELKVGDYSRAYQRLTRLEQTDEVNTLKYYATLRSKNYGLSLGLLSKIEMNPDLKKKLLSGILKDSDNEYSKISPIIRR